MEVELEMADDWPEKHDITEMVLLLRKVSDGRTELFVATGLIGFIVICRLVGLGSPMWSVSFSGGDFLTVCL